MKHMKKRCVAFVLLFALLLLSTATVLAADKWSAYAGEVKTVEYSYAPSGGSEDATDICYFYDGWFAESAYEYNTHLATAALSLALSSGGSNGADVTEKSRNLVGLLTSLGFTDVAVNEDFKKVPTEHSIGVAVGQKKIEQSGGEATLIAVAPRSSGYGREWADNFTVGTTGKHEGFSASADKVAQFLKEYIAEHHIVGTVKLLITGYSRGGAVSNLLGGKLVDAPNALGVNIPAENVFVYAFAAPRGVPADLNPRAAKYGNIHNILLEYDAVPMVAPAAWKFERYGVDRVLTTVGTVKEEMLANLAKLNADVYEKFTAAEEGDDPDRFGYKYYDFSDGLKTVAADAAVHISQKEFLTSRLDYIAADLLGSRTRYEESYAPVIEGFMSFYFGASAPQRKAFSEAVKGDGELLTKTVVFLYAYHAFDLFAKRNPTAGEMQTQLRDLEAFAKELSPAFYQTLVSMDSYNTLKTAVNLMAKTMPNSQIAGVNYVWALICNALKNEGASNLGVLLRKALTAANADSAFVAKLTGEEQTKLLAEFAAGALFGSRNEPTKGIFTKQSTQLSTAATLIGNLPLVTRAHGYEVMMARLRTEDSYFGKKLPTTVTFRSDISKTYDGQTVTAPEVKVSSGAPYMVEYKEKSAPDEAYTEAPPKDAGNYSVRVTAAENVEYERGTAVADFIIRKAKLTVSIDSKQKIYGDKDAPLTYTAEGLVSGDALDLSLIREAGEDAGEYAITPLSVPDLKNYTLTVVDGKYTIAQRDITGAVVTLGEVLTADGTPKTQEVRAVTLNGKPVTFNVTGNTAETAGVYVMQITGVGNYCGTVAQKFAVVGEDIEKLGIHFDVKVGNNVPEMRLESPLTELILSAFDSGELARIAEGERAELWLSVDTAPEPAVIPALLDRTDEWIHLKVTLMKQLSDGEPTEAELRTPLRFSLSLPEKTERTGRRFFAAGLDSAVETEVTDGKITVSLSGGANAFSILYRDYCPICETRTPFLFGLCYLPLLGLTAFIIIGTAVGVLITKKKKAAK